MMKKELKFLKEGILEAEQQSKKAIKHIEFLEKKKVELFIPLHRRLVDVGFYENYNVHFRSNKLNQMFCVRNTDNSLPYRYMCEGDYHKIIFKVSGNKLVLLYYNTCECGNEKYKRLISIPLDLFEIEDNQPLMDYLNLKYIQAEETRQRIKKSKIEKEIEKLQKEL